MRHLDSSKECLKRTKDIAKIATPHGVAYMVSPDERVAASKVLRGKISRKHHGEWRPNPIDFLHKSAAGRMKKLVAIQYGRMLQSLFCLLSRDAFGATGTGHFSRAGYLSQWSQFWVRQLHDAKIKGDTVRPTAATRNGRKSGITKSVGSAAAVLRR